jgi:cytochrome c oxidase accessory protein FixG
MFDQSTKMVSYDTARGENRGSRKRSAVKPSGMGDCVDCDLCVQVCPVGIDIRNGLQYECINCGLCVDACDMTMEKFDYKKGLISFINEQPPKDNWKRHLGYGSVVLVTLLTMLAWATTWQSFDVNIIRDRQELFSINQDGNTENTFLFKVRNKSSHVRQYQVQVNELAHAKITGSATVKVLPGELTIHSITVVAEKPLLNVKSDVSFNITDLYNNESMRKNTSFYSTKDTW